MYFRKIKHKLLFSMLIISILLLGTACSTKNDKNLVDLQTCKYVVSLSKVLDYNSKLLFIDQMGNVHGTYNYEGYSINSINEINNSFVMHSNRLNKHFVLDQQQNLSSYTLYKTQFDNAIKMASRFSVKGADGLIETMNIGGKETSNSFSSVIFSNKGMQHQVILKNQVLNNAIDVNDNIFVESYLKSDETNGISVIDKVVGAEKTRLTFPETYISNSGVLLALNGKIYTYGDNRNSESKASIKSGIGSVDSMTLDTKMNILDTGVIVTMYLYDNTVHAITDENQLLTFDENLKVINRKDINNPEFLNALLDKSYTLGKVLHDEDSVHVFYVSVDSNNPEYIGFIQEYRKSDLEVLNRTEVKNPGSKIWMGESVDFILKNGS